MNDKAIPLSETIRLDADDENNYALCDDLRYYADEVVKMEQALRELGEVFEVAKNHRKHDINCGGPHSSKKLETAFMAVSDRTKKILEGLK